LFTASRLDILDNSSLTLQYNRNRYYDQYTGRFFTHDPLGITPNPQWPNRFDIAHQYQDGFSLYEYVRSKPTRSLDSHGLLIKGFPGGKNCTSWENNGNAAVEIKKKRGCTEVTLGELPPSIPIVDLIVEVAGLFAPGITVCNAEMDTAHFEPGYLCECTWVVKRPCKRHCCRKYYMPVGIFTWECSGSRRWLEEADRNLKYLKTYGTSFHYHHKFRLECSCPDPAGMRSPEYWNKFKCE